MKTSSETNIGFMFSDGSVDRHTAPELDETNYIEPEPEPVRDREPQPRAQTPSPSSIDNPERNQVVSTEQMCKESYFVFFKSMLYFCY